MTNSNDKKNPYVMGPWIRRSLRERLKVASAKARLSMRDYMEQAIKEALKNKRGA